MDTSNDKEIKQFLTEISEQLSVISNRINSFLNKTNRVDLRTAIDYDDLLKSFQGHNFKTDDDFLGNYIFENINQVDYSKSEIIDVLKEVNSFIEYSKKQKK